MENSKIIYFFPVHNTGLYDGHISRKTFKLTICNGEGYLVNTSLHV